MLFIQGQALFWPNLRNGWSDWCEMKRKCIGWILGIICDLDLWPHSWPWPWMFQGQISKLLYLRNCWSDWCEMKRNQINRILGQVYDLAIWPHPWHWPWSFKVRVLSQEWDGGLTWNVKESSIYTMVLWPCLGKWGISNGWNKHTNPVSYWFIIYILYFHSAKLTEIICTNT